MEQRKKNVIRNILAKWLSVFLITILQLVSRKVFIQYFTDSLLGLRSLLQSIISMLSLLELGVGSAIYFSLYEPLANNDEQKINGIMALYKKIYSIIGVLVLFLGIVLMVFISHFVDTDVSLNTVRIAFVILLFDTVSSYFLAYRRNIFNADQKEYICTNIDTVTSIIAIVFQIGVTVLTRNYYLCLISKVVWTIIANFYIYTSAGKKYPYIKQTTNYKLPSEYMNKFKKDVKALCVSNISTYLVFGTDNLLISTFVSLGSVFIYSNYNTVIMTVNKLFHNIFNSTQASVGNYMVVHGKDKAYDLFEKMFFANYMITSFTTVSLLTMLNSFMVIWLGEKYTWPIAVVAVLVLNNYLRYIGQTVSVFRNAAGIYSPYIFYKYWGIVEGAINVGASLLFIQFFKGNEIVGVFVGTTISTVLVYATTGPHALFKYYFGIKKIKRFIQRYVVYTGLTIIYVFISLGSLYVLNISNIYLKFFVSSVISLLVPNLLNIALFYKTEEFTYFKDILVKKISK